MRKYNWLFAVPVVILCFAIVFTLASKQVQQRNEEIAQIHHSAEAVIGDYLKGQTVTAVLYNSIPIYFDKNSCIVRCRVDSVDELGYRHRTGFDVLFRWEKKVWKAAIVGTDRDLPVIKKIKKPRQKGL